jgi:hypothetical protein
LPPAILYYIAGIDVPAGKEISTKNVRAEQSAANIRTEVLHNDLQISDFYQKKT